MHEKTDEELYKIFLHTGREEALGILMDRHSASLTLFLYNYVNRMEDAQELMLDAFAEVAAGPTLFSGRSAFKTWLFSIGKNLAKMHLRKRRFVTESLDELPEKAAEEGSFPEEMFLEQERNRQLYRALSFVKEEYRMVLMLVYFEDMSYEEAARVMGKSKKQIYHLIERGKKALKEQLEKAGTEL